MEFGGNLKDAFLSGVSAGKMKSFVVAYKYIISGAVTTWLELPLPPPCVIINVCL